MILLNSAKTTTGIVRTENQDSFGVKQDEDFFFVCDGMGGGVAGDFASKCAVDVILALFDKITKQDSISILGKEFESFDEKIIRPITLIKLANRTLNNITKKYPKLAGMGTTCSAVWFERNPNLVHIYNVGDSRVYRIRNGKIQLLTEDHSKIKELIDSGKMTAEEAKTAEIQSMITRALGISKTVKVDYKSEIVKTGDIYVLCTDGLNGELSDFTINDIVNLHKPDVASISDELILAANNAGGRDNTTVICVYSQAGMEPASLFQTVVPQKEIIVSKDEDSSASAKEDFLIHKYSKEFKVSVPELATRKNVFKSPLFIALILVVFCICGIFVYSLLFNKGNEQKSIVELTGSVSGINLDVRTINSDKMTEIINTEDKVFKLQILQEVLNNIDTFTVAMPNVTVTLSFEGQNKFMGLSGYKPLDIKLPTGKYLMSLDYSGYKILDENFKLKDAVDVYLENSNGLFGKIVIMVPEKDFGNM